jgi:hypothetical protein
MARYSSGYSTCVFLNFVLYVCNSTRFTNAQYSLLASARVEPVTTIVSTTGVDGHTTYLLSLSLAGDANNVYTLFGAEDQIMSIPAAYQTAEPFGQDIRGDNMGYRDDHPSDAFDSWLTLESGVIPLRTDCWKDAGADDAVACSCGMSIGMSWDSWTEDSGLTVDNGAVFCFPGDGPTQEAGLVAIAQLTIPSDAEARFITNIQGQTKTGARYNALNIVFDMPQDAHCPTAYLDMYSDFPHICPRGVDKYSVTGVTEEVQVDGIAGYTTYHLKIVLGSDLTNVYALFGTESCPLRMPPAHRVMDHPDPWIQNFDSFLTLASDISEQGIQYAGGGSGPMSIQMGTWSELNELRVTNGALVYIPGQIGHAQRETIVAQISVPTSSVWTAVVNAQGMISLPDHAIFGSGQSFLKCGITFGSGKAATWKWQGSVNPEAYGGSTSDAISGESIPGPAQQTASVDYDADELEAQASILFAAEPSVRGSMLTPPSFADMIEPESDANALLQQMFTVEQQPSRIFASNIVLLGNDENNQNDGKMARTLGQL